MSFQPFEFIINHDKRTSIEEKVENLGDTIKVIVVNLLRVAEHCEQRFADLEAHLHAIELKLLEMDQKVNHLQVALQSAPSTVHSTTNSLETPRNLTPPPKVESIHQPISERSVSNKDVRRDIISELKRVFTERKQAEMSEDN